MLYSIMKLHVSAYNGHHQVSIPIKGSLLSGGGCWCRDLYASIPCCSIVWCK